MSFPPRLRATHLVRAAERGRPWQVAVWLLLLAALAAAAALRAQGNPVTSDLLQLLPSVREDPLLAQAVDRSRSTFLHSLMIAVTGPSPGTVATAAAAIHRSLAKGGYRIEGAGAAGDALISFYRRHRFVLLGPGDIRALSSRPDQTFVARLLAGLATPGSPAGTQADPGGFFTRYLASLPRPYPQLVPDDGLLMAPAAPQPSYLIALKLSGAALGTSGEAEASRAVRLARDAAARVCPACRLYASGPALYSAAERSETKNEVSWLSSAATVLIVLLVLAVFRSLRPLALTVLCVASGIVAGAAATLIIFREINLLTLVFGTTLLGIAVDYAFHYLADHHLNEGPGTLGRILPGLTLGLLTSVIAFAFLAATAFPALRQLAAFSIAGLAGAYLTVLLLFPVAGRRPGRVPETRLMDRLVRLSVGGGRRWRAIATLALIAGAAGGLARLHALDDVRELQSAPRQLTHETAAIDRLLGAPAAPGFLLVRGANLAAALRRERRLDAVARHSAPGGIFVGLAGFVPSERRQRRSLASWAGLLRDGGAALDRAVTAAGVPSVLIHRLLDEWRHAPRRTISPADVLAAFPALRSLEVRAAGKTGLLVQVFGTIGDARLRALAASVPGVNYVDPLARLNASFTSIREHATAWVVVGYFVIFVLLLARYGLLGGVAAMAPCVAAAIGALGLLGWMGQPVNVFVIVALMLVAGIGVDYAVFLRESADSHGTATALAVALAAVTTLASFGLLALSHIPSIHAFGLTVAVGILVSWLAAPLALGGRRSPA